MQYLWISITNINVLLQRYVCLFEVLLKYVTYEEFLISSLRRFECLTVVGRNELIN